MPSESTNSMSSAPSDGKARPVEAVRAQFEAAWQSAGWSRRPCISDYLAGIPEPERSAVLCSLLAVDLHYRKQLGEHPTPDEYIQLFPESASHIQSFFEETGTKRAPDTSSLSGSGHPAKTEPRRAADTPTTSYYPDEDDCEATSGSTNKSGAAAPLRALSTAPLAKKNHLSSRNWQLPKVPGYEVLAELGEGGMGVVFKAHDLQLQCLVALKMIRPDRSRGAQDMETLLAEARAVARCRHANLVHIYTIAENDAQPYLALEFMEGGNLSDKLAGTPQGARESAALIETLARAMEYAHQKGIVHCDLKPSNVLLSADGTPKISDFGLAKRLDEDAAPAADHLIVGTPSYMAAEQAWGRNDQVGAPADIYALGAILYETLTGRPPFKAATKWQTILLVRNTEPVPPRKLVPQVPFELELICLKCLRKDPQARYASAGQLADELRRFKEGRPLLHTRPTPRWEVAWKWAKREPAWAALATVSLVALLSVLFSLDQRARTAEGETQRLQRISDLRGQVHEWRLNAQSALDQGKLDEAHGRVMAALKVVDAEPLLADLKPGLLEVNTAVERHQEVRAGIKTADAVYEQFARHRDIALFHGMVFTGVDLPTNSAAAKVACRDALSLFTNSKASNGCLVFPAYFTQARRTACTTACYELLLIWAEAEAAVGNDGKPAREGAAHALACLDWAAQIHATTRAYHLRRERYLMLQGKHDEASREGQLAAALESKGAHDYFLTGDSSMKQGRWSQAADQFARAVREEPGHFWAWYFLGMCNLQLQRPDLAVANFSACLDKRKDFPWPYLMRGFANGQLNHFEDAAKDFDQALNATPDSQAQYGIHVHRAVLCLHQAKRGNAGPQLALPTPLTPNFAFVRTGVAEVVYRDERLRSAVAFLEKARVLQEDAYPAYLYLALTRQQQNRLDEAADLLGQAIAKARDQNRLVRAHLHGQRARLRHQQQQLPAALEDLQAAIDLFPSAEDHAERGRILYALKEYGKAVLAFDAALALKPDSAEVYRWKAEALLAVPRSTDNRDDQRAIAALEKYLWYSKAKDAAAAEAYRKLGMLHARRGQAVESIVAYQKAAELQPDAATIAARGWAYLAIDDARHALEDFTEAIQRDPGHAAAYAGRALVRARQGRQTEALSDIALALQHGEAKPSALLFWNVANVYAQIAANVRMKSPPYEHDYFQRRGVAMLESALLQTPEDKRTEFWEEYVAGNALLASLRRSDGYARLENQYGRRIAKQR